MLLFSLLLPPLNAAPGQDIFRSFGKLWKGRRLTTATTAVVVVVEESVCAVDAGGCIRGEWIAVGTEMGVVGSSLALEIPTHRHDQMGRALKPITKANTKSSTIKSVCNGY